MSDPQPLRIRLLEHTRKKDKVVGHWFLRPTPQRDKEGWKLSFWHPQHTWGKRRREEGFGYDQAMYVFASTFYELAQHQYEKYRSSLAMADAMMSGRRARPGFRPDYLKRQRSLLVSQWKQWSDKLLEDSQTYLAYAVECGWPEVERPAFPWETP